MPTAHIEKALKFLRHCVSYQGLKVSSVAVFLPLQLLFVAGCIDRNILFDNLSVLYGLLRRHLGQMFIVCLIAHGGGDEGVSHGNRNRIETGRTTREETTEGGRRRDEVKPEHLRR